MRRGEERRGEEKVESEVGDLEEGRPRRAKSLPLKMGREVGEQVGKAEGCWKKMQMD